VSEITEGAFSVKSLRGAGADPILNELYTELFGFASLLKKHGVEVAIDSAAAREAWHTLDKAAKQKILQTFAIYHRNCREMHAAGVSLRDNRALVSHSLKRAHLFAQDNTDGLFGNDHMVEVYNLSDIQIFRSINFFDYCNYSLLDLLAREWMDLYERLPSITESIFKEIHASVAAKELRPFHTPAHIMKERDANPCGVFRTDFRHCCPLYSAPGQLAGYLLVLDVAEIDLEAADQQKVAFLPVKR
jgi:hypothetical protein